MKTTGLRTLPQICRAYGVTDRQGEYVVRSFGIEPTDRCGIVRLYDEATINRIVEGLKRTGAVAATTGTCA